MNKYYKVFISSTYADLQEERQYVMQALMEMDCIPAGMEFFPATDEEQWEFIKRVIDDCDYYLIIIGGRYGSVSRDGISYTEKEYDYAVQKGIRIVRLLHKNLGKISLDKSEKNPENFKKLESFYNKVKAERLVKFWEKPEELQALAVLALNHEIRNHPAIGFVRADLVPDENSISEILNLRNQIIDLQNQIKSISTNAPEGTEKYVQGEDLFEIHYSFVVSKPKNLLDFELDEKIESYKEVITFTWNQIFSSVAPLMINEAIENMLNHQLNMLVYKAKHNSLSAKKEFSQKILSQFAIDDNDFQQIKIQLRSLGLITQSTKKRGIKDNETYWTLTPYGDTIMTRLIAIKRKV
jgi:hypothetical protein